jgi:4-carboxymuconolactone decarboxylase
MIQQTAGRDQLGDFAPKFAQLNDDVLFGEVWNREGLSLKAALHPHGGPAGGQGAGGPVLPVPRGKRPENGVTRDEMAEILTHAAFYAGWPNAWAAFRVAAEVYRGGPGADGGMFGLGQPNWDYAQYFTGTSCRKPLTPPGEPISLANVTFEPGCRSHWHIHHAAKGGGQVLLCTNGRGWYQAWGSGARELHPGGVAYIPSTGTARPGTAGSATLPWKSLGRAVPPSGAGAWTTESIAPCAEKRRYYV